MQSYSEAFCVAVSALLNAETQHRVVAAQWKSNSALALQAVSCPTCAKGAACLEPVH